MCRQKPAKVSGIFQLAMSDGHEGEGYHVSGVCILASLIFDIVCHIWANNHPLTSYLRVPRVLGF